MLMKLKTMYYIAAAMLAAGWVHHAAAQTTSWTGLGNDGNWNNANNWSSGIPTNTAGEYIFIDPVANGTSPTIHSGDSVSVGTLSTDVPGGTYGTIYGPEFGQHLNIYGTLRNNWMMAPVQNDPAPGNRTIVNLYAGSSLISISDALGTAANIGIGYPWWWYYDAPYVTFNMYGNASMSVGFLGLGGHLNIYDTASVSVSNVVFTGTINALSDGTASLVIGGLLDPAHRFYQ